MLSGLASAVSRDAQVEENLDLCAGEDKEKRKREERKTKSLTGSLVAVSEFHQDHTWVVGLQASSRAGLVLRLVLPAAGLARLTCHVRGVWMLENPKFELVRSPPLVVSSDTWERKRKKKKKSEKAKNKDCRQARGLSADSAVGEMRKRVLAIFWESLGELFGELLERGRT